MANFWEPEAWTQTWEDIKDAPSDAWNSTKLAFGSGAAAGGDKIDDMSGKNAADKRDRELKKALKKAESATERMFDKSMETQRPWLEAGARGLSQLESGINSGQFKTDPGSFSYGDYQAPDAYQDPGNYQAESFQFDFEADPGYKFRMEQGMKALEGSAAARGGLFSSNTGDRIADYAQGLASQEYGNAYNRARGAYEADRNFGRNAHDADRNFGRGNYETDRGFGRNTYTQDRSFASGDFMDDFNRRRGVNTDQYNRLAALSGTGQLSAGNIGNQQMAQGGNLANIAQQRGNVEAQSAMGGWNRGMGLANLGLQAAGIGAGFMAGGPAGAAVAGGGLLPHKNVPEVPLY